MGSLTLTSHKMMSSCVEAYRSDAVVICRQLKVCIWPRMQILQPHLCSTISVFFKVCLVGGDIYNNNSLNQFLLNKVTLSSLFTCLLYRSNLILYHPTDLQKPTYSQLTQQSAHKFCQADCWRAQAERRLIHAVPSTQMAVERTQKWTIWDPPFPLI
jgi:hypothetical protein